MRWTVVLDRDGTLNVKAPEGDYVRGPEGLTMLPGAARAVAELNRAGLRVELVADGAHLDAVYVCPHEDGVCDCRKPGTGLFRRAREADPDIDFARAVMVGDSATDVAAGR